MKKRYFTSVLLLMGLLLCYLSAAPEMLTFGWHLTHGQRQTFATYSIPVPLDWTGTFDDSGRWFSIDKAQGPVRIFLFGPSGASIGFSSTPMPRPGTEIVGDFAKSPPPDYGTVITSIRQIADFNSSCEQHTVKVLPKMVYIQCFPNGTSGIEVHFAGDSQHVPEFFAILDGVKKTN